MSVRAFLPALAVWLPAVVAAQDATVQPQSVLEGLEAPVAVAVHPASKDVFVADAGRGQVLRWSEEQPDAQILIQGFPSASWSDDGPPISPAGMAVVRQDALAVCHRAAEGGFRVSVYQLSDELDEPLDAAAPLKSVGIDDPAGRARAWRVLRRGTWVAVTTLGAAEQPAVWRLMSDSAAGVDGAFEPLGSTGVEQPSGLTISPRGELVVASSGVLDTRPDARLFFFHATAGRKLLDLATDRVDLVDVAYSPRAEKSLYAIDMAWSQPSQGGLYRMDAALGDRGLEVVATRIAALQRPTGLAFGRDGSLYVTQLGPERDPPNGTLVRFSPGL